MEKEPQTLSWRGEIPHDAVGNYVAKTYSDSVAKINRISWSPHVMSKPNRKGGKMSGMKRGS